MEEATPEEEDRHQHVYTTFTLSQSQIHSYIEAAELSGLLTWTSQESPNDHKYV